MISLTELTSNKHPKWPVTVAFLNFSGAGWTEDFWCFFKVKLPCSNTFGVEWTSQALLMYTYACDWERTNCLAMSLWKTGCRRWRSNTIKQGLQTEICLVINQRLIVFYLQAFYVCVCMYPVWAEGLMVMWNLHNKHLPIFPFATPDSHNDNNKKNHSTSDTAANDVIHGFGFFLLCGIGCMHCRSRCRRVSN